MEPKSSSRHQVAMEHRLDFLRTLTQPDRHGLQSTRLEFLRSQQETYGAARIYLPWIKRSLMELGNNKAITLF